MTANGERIQGHQGEAEAILEPEALQIRPKSGHEGTEGSDYIERQSHTKWKATRPPQNRKITARAMVSIDLVP